MRFLFLLFIPFSLLLLSSCNKDETQNDLGAIIEGNFRGVLRVDGDIVSNDFQVKLTRLSTNSIVLNSSECDEIEVMLSGSGVLAIFGSADTIDNFNYLVEEEELQFLVNNFEIFKIFEGSKE